MEGALVHGVLEATINEATDLVLDHRRAPNFLRKLCTCYNVQLIEEIEEILGIGKGLSRIYATIDFGTARVARTRPMKYANSNPKWNESFFIYCAYEADQITIEVKDELTIGAVVLGKTHIRTARLLSGQTIEGWFDLFSAQDNDKLTGKISIKLQFHDVRADPSWGQGIKGNNIPSVHHSFFKQESGNKITLYQDAHTSDQFRPRISLSQGRIYEPARCWEDIYKALSGAKYIIYITGWSVYTKITLVRDMERRIPGAQDVTLGDLLKRKADEGVRVLLLVWDDRTSVSLGLPGAKTTVGIMHTHDEDTGAYFRGSKVHCVLCPRNPDNGTSIVQGIEVGLMFTHHQKTIVVDVGVSEQNTVRRKLVSFVGGIDLCDGRYDNQSHPLFRTLNTVHKDDFHQTNFDGASLKQGGPREPWHDVHSRIEGPAAWDVHTNFEQRWRKQAKRRHLLSLETIPDLWPPAEVVKDGEPESWNAQIFRSIDEGAIDGFPKDPETAAQKGLVFGKENIIERSIQDAYICAIRRAKRFIYMENQYFLGSSASWSSHKDVGASQLIPMELTQKIISKIEAGERFAVYVVIPMWPEGVPESGAVQDILYWQRLTMEMMYKHIAIALEKKGMSGSAVPTDYLNFFCLGNRELRHEGEYEPSETPEDKDYRNAQEHRRFMIYVHAKTMIVDDEYIIVGSANCNQRSMDGARDSEIAVGAYQTRHVMANSSNAKPQGQVYGFRMSLWYEHMGKTDKDFQNPESLACVKKVQTISKELWHWYIGSKIIDMPAHLLPYPISVLPNGEVKSLPGQEKFPDTNANVLGSHSETLPPILTV